MSGICMHAHCECMRMPLMFVVYCTLHSNNKHALSETKNKISSSYWWNGQSAQYYSMKFDTLVLPVKLECNLVAWFIHQNNLSDSIWPRCVLGIQLICPLYDIAGIWKLYESHHPLVQLNLTAHTLIDDLKCIFWHQLYDARGGTWAWKMETMTSQLMPCQWKWQ